MKGGTELGRIPVPPKIVNNALVVLGPTDDVENEWIVPGHAGSSISFLDGCSVAVMPADENDVPRELRGDPDGYLEWVWRAVGKGGQRRSERIFEGPIAPSPAIELRIIPGMMPLDTVYSIFDDGLVRRRQHVLGKGAIYGEERRYVSAVEVSSFRRLLDEGQVLSYTAADIDAHFPDGLPEVSESSAVVLTVRDSASGGSDCPSLERTAMNSGLLAGAPGFAPARALSDLARLRPPLRVTRGEKAARLRPHRTFDAPSGTHPSVTRPLPLGAISKLNTSVLVFIPRPTLFRSGRATRTGSSGGRA